MLGRQIRSPLELLRPLHNKIEFKNMSLQDKKCKTVPMFTEGETVLFRDYRNSQNKWSQGIVHQKIGDLHYQIQSNGQIFKRHLDQILKSNLKNPCVTDNDIINQVPSDDESLNKLVKKPVNKGTVSPEPKPPVNDIVLPRHSSRNNKGKPPLRYPQSEHISFDESGDSDF